MIRSILLAGLVAMLGVEAAAERPTVVSLDYCADQFVLGLADRDQILAVSKDAEKPFSHLRAEAKGLRKVRASAEDVIAIAPDIVLRSWGGDARALRIYEAAGISTVQIGYASSIEAAADITRDVAASLGQSERAEKLLSIERAEPEAISAMAIYLTPSGVTAGRETTIDSLMTNAGIANGVDAVGWTSLPLEQLVLNPPSFALTAFFGFDTDGTDFWSLSRHPVMQQILADAETIALTESRLTCPTWLIMDEVASIRAQVNNVE